MEQMRSAAERLALQLRSGLAEYLEDEQVDAELDEVKCAMICEALGESVSSYYA